MTRRTTTKPRKKAARNKARGRLDLRFSLEGGVVPKFLDQARALSLQPAENAALLIDNGVAPQQLTDDDKRYRSVTAIAELLRQLPGVNPGIGVSHPSEAFWWIKFHLDVAHPLAWHVIQRLGFVLNYYGLESRFLTKFYPVSPPPYLNGGPKEYLSWVLEAELRYVDPRPVIKALRAELPGNPRSVNEWRAFDAH